MNFNDLFKEFIYIGCLTETEQIKYHLICRYEDKVSKRLLDEKKQLYEEGKEESKRIMLDCLTTPNPFLEAVKGSFGNGNLYHQPVILGLEHGITLSIKK